MKNGIVKAVIFVIAALILATGCDQNGSEPDPTAQELANSFKKVHVAALALTVDTVNADNKTEVNAALAAYNELSDAVKALLSAEKTLLDNLNVEIEEVQIFGKDIEPAIELTAGRQTNVITVIPDGVAVKTAIQALDVAFDPADITPASVEGAVIITLSGNDSNASDTSKVTIKSKTITITSGGVYAVSGTLEGGQIIVHVSKNDDVSLILNGVNINANGTKFVPVSFYNTEHDGELGNGKRIVTLIGENFLQDDPKAAKTGVYDPKPKGVIYSEQTLTVNGSGSATIAAKSHSGIYSLGKLKIANVGNITVTEAPNSALRGDLGVVIKGGVFDLKSVKDTIKSEANEDEDPSNDTDYIYIEDADITITTITGESLYNDKPDKAGYYVNLEGKGGWDGDGVSALKAVWIKSGSIRIKTATGSSEGGYYDRADTVTIGGTEVESKDPSLKGIKSDGSVLIEGGALTFDCRDDAVKADDSIIITGGTLTIRSDGDGLDADNQLIIDAGVITIERSHEGLQGKQIVLNGGDIAITSNDDGVSVSSGNNAVTDDTFAVLAGGSLAIHATADGIDSNGRLLISGGAITTVHTGRGLQNDKGESATIYEPIDTDRGYQITSGTLYALSDSDFQYPSDASTQHVLLLKIKDADTPDYNTGATKSAGTRIVITDSSKTIVADYTADRPFGRMLISVPAFATGEIYSLYIDDAPIKRFTLHESGRSKINDIE
jgi:hypothetical protein